MKRVINFSVLVLLSLAVGATAYAADLDDAYGTVDNIREADPPSYSTSTKESPVGQPVTDYKPKANTLTTTEPPSPQSNSSYNPNNDPDVEKGYQNHQKQYGH